MIAAYQAEEQSTRFMRVSQSRVTLDSQGSATVDSRKGLFLRRSLRRNASLFCCALETSDFVCVCAGHVRVGSRQARVCCPPSHPVLRGGQIWLWPASQQRGQNLTPRRSTAARVAARVYHAWCLCALCLGSFWFGSRWVVGLERWVRR